MVLIAFVATKATTGSQNLTSTLIKFNYDWARLGAGEKWQGWRYRMTLYRDFCRSLDPQKLIVCMDADDVLAVRSFDQAAFAECFQSFGRSIVVAAETVCFGNCTPLDEYWSGHPNVPLRKYANAGVIMGSASELASMYQWMLDTGLEDDQVALGRFINAHPDKVALDSENRLFYCYPTKSEYYDPGIKWDESNVLSLRDDLTGEDQSPYLVHFPGNFYMPAFRSWLNQKPERIQYDDFAQGILGANALAAYQPNGVASFSTFVLFWSMVSLALVAMLAAVGFWWRSRRQLQLRIQEQSGNGRNQRQKSV